MTAQESLPQIKCVCSAYSPHNILSYFNLSSFNFLQRYLKIQGVMSFFIWFCSKYNTLLGIF
jgi:hypothetical protein